MKNNRRKKLNYFLYIGLLGFIVVFCMNLFSLYIIKKESAIFLNKNWYSDWFPNYIVWFVFIIIGLIIEYNRKKDRRIFFK